MVVSNTISELRVCISVETSQELREVVPKFPAPPPSAGDFSSPPSLDISLKDNRDGSDKVVVLSATFTVSSRLSSGGTSIGPSVATSVLVSDVVSEFPVSAADLSSLSSFNISLGNQSNSPASFRVSVSTVDSLTS